MHRSGVTAEQWAAIEAAGRATCCSMLRRARQDLGAGRAFVRAVLEDGVDVGAVLTNTSPPRRPPRSLRLDPARAARARGRGGGARPRAPSSRLSTASRSRRGRTRAVRIDPAFAVLGSKRAERLMDPAVRRRAVGGFCCWRRGMGSLRSAVLATHAELRSRGQSEPAQPRPARATAPGRAARSRSRRSPPARTRGAGPRRRCSGRSPSRASRSSRPLRQLDRCDALLDERVLVARRPRPPQAAGGNGAALSTDRMRGLLAGAWAPTAPYARPGRPVRSVIGSTLS